MGFILKDVVGGETGDGTTKIMKLIIAYEALGRKFLPYHGLGRLEEINITQ